LGLLVRRWLDNLLAPLDLNVGVKLMSALLKSFGSFLTGSGDFSVKLLMPKLLAKVVVVVVKYFSLYELTGSIRDIAESSSDEYVVFELISDVVFFR